MITAFLAAAPAGDSAGLPQFNPEFFTSQLFWLAVTFLGLYLFLSRIALPRIGDVVEARRDRIKRDLDEAQRMKTQTDAALKAYEDALAGARGRAQGIVKETRDRQAAELETARQRADAENAARLGQIEAQIATNKAKALANVDDIAVETAGAIVGRLIGEDVATAEIKSAVAAVKR